MSECSKYVMLEEGENRGNCHCPICGGFLPLFDIDDKLRCKKCGTELLILPDYDEDTDKQLDWGRICPISKPQSQNTRKGET